MVRAKAKRIKVGRPRLAIELRQEIAQRAARGQTFYGLAKALGIDRHMVAKYAEKSCGSSPSIPECSLL
jgi:hypothetical protein